MFLMLNNKTKLHTIIRTLTAVCATAGALALIMLLQLILAGLILILVLSLIKKSDLKALPGPRWSVPLFGHLFYIGNYPHKTFLQWKKHYGPVYKVNMGTLPFVIINDGPLMRKTFNSAICSARPNMRIYEDYSFNGRGFVGAEPQVSRERRQFFVKNVLKESNFKGDTLENRIITEVGHLVAKMEATLDQPVEIVGLFTQHIVNVLMNVMTSMRFEDGDPRVLQFQHGVEQVSRFGGFGDILVYYMPLLGESFPNLSGYSKKVQVFNEIVNFFRPILAAHRELYEKDTPRDLLDAYLDNLANPKNSDANDELNVLVTLSDLFVAGMETTSKSLEWLIYYLIKHPEIQTKMHLEIKNTLQGHQVSLHHRPELNYTAAVIEETLRKSTVVRLGLIHAATEDYELSAGVVSKGTFIMGNLYGVNHDPEVWEDPDVFCPDRFLDEEGKFKKREDMFAFSTGKRGCIGEVIARYQLFLYAATIFQRFDIDGTQEGLPSEDGTGIIVGPGPFKAKFKLVQ